MSLKAKKKGFTLIEVLVVLAIIAALSSLAVNGYLQYRKSALLDLSADNIISQFFEMRSKTIHGEVDRERFESIKLELEGNKKAEDISAPEGSAECFGLYFKKDMDVFNIRRSFSQEFLGQKVLDLEKGWVYRGCEEFNPLNERDLELDEDINIVNISYGMEVRDLVIRFSPPNGEVELRVGGFGEFESDFNPDPNADNVVEMEIQYLEDSDFRRIIEFDLIDGTADVKKP